MTTRAPTRLIAWLIALALVALPIVGLMQGWFASGSWPIRTLNVEAEYDHVSAPAIRRAILPHIHRGFFATDLGDVRRALDALPWVASASARKRWPDTLVIRVRERHPFAHWNTDQLVDRHGRLFTVPDAAQVDDLPRLSGPTGHLDEVVNFYLNVRGQLAAVGLHVTGAHLDRRGGWSVALAGGAHLVIGRNEPDARLARFIRVYPELAGTHRQRFSYADLRYTNGFAVRWPPAAASAPSGASRT
jgi:cell division protein FtsQ